ncbi:FAD-dependent oxidoreductase [Methylomicrobium sp. Wu6]|uniref:dihydrolipoyl dehydrogenase family protein n=1 Tax=Methylomicrobium sp. Wu6 TaxID=3107928 RepID=UPI002DD64B11|nr:FAD-dependent oxidoreductase [Methylomicrobium sp. Wu6]MEC4749975.1 FAD-dependent oxidoreductase [Methylomicrobium sp. Wu6]
MKPDTAANLKPPKKFDYNIAVIGAGSAGLVTSYIAAAVKAKVILIEKHRMGGDCLHTGCVPSKALIRATRLLALGKRSAEFGIKQMPAEFAFGEIMERVQTVIKTVAPHDSIERYTGLGVEVATGSAKLISPWTIEITEETGTRNITARAIVISAGAHPLVPPIPGLEQTGYLTSDTVWNLRTAPKRLLILGGGPIGCELAQCFARLGIQMTLIEMAPRLLLREDPEVSTLIEARFRSENIDLKLSHTAKQFIIQNGEKILFAEHDGKTVTIPFDDVLVALGRAANVTGYGLEELGVALSPNKSIRVDAFQATNFRHIFACGDVAGPYQFTHTAAHQAWYAAANALFGDIKKFRTDYSVIPWATFTEPEIAHVGLNEQEAKAQGLSYEVSIYNLADLDRAIADGEAQGFVKVLTVPGKDKILGVTIAGEHAGDLIAEFILAMKHNIGLNKILGTIHIYPTLAEANKYAAGVWKRGHQPEILLKWLAKFHTWRRG